MRSFRTVLPGLLFASILAAAAALPVSAQRSAKPATGPILADLRPLPSPAKVGSAATALSALPRSLSLPVRPEPSIDALHEGLTLPRSQPHISGWGQGITSSSRGAGAVERLSNRLSPLRDTPRHSGSAADSRGFLHRFFFGSAPDAPGAEAVPTPEAGFIRNDEGVLLRADGHAAKYYLEVDRLRKKLDKSFGGPVNLGSTMSIMKDSEEETLVKMRALERLAAGRPILSANVHLSGTRSWIDGIVENPDGTLTAIETLRVFYHHAKNPRSEIAEGKRRIKHALIDTSYFFQPKGRAEDATGPINEVVLALDTRGYSELKRLVQQNIPKIFGKHIRRFKFVFLDDIHGFRVSPDRISAELNAISQRHGSGSILQNIREGVLYSRYVGLLLELRTIEHLVDSGYEILHSGIELFDENDMYITELDVVARKNGHISIWESKSFRQRIPFGNILKYEIKRKLGTYRDHSAYIRRVLGGKSDVFFALDVGRHVNLISQFRNRQEALKNEFQRPVSFIFLKSYPDENLDGNDESSQVSKVTRTAVSRKLKKGKTTLKPILNKNRPGRHVRADHKKSRDRRY